MGHRADEVPASPAHMSSDAVMAFEQVMTAASHCDVTFVGALTTALSRRGRQDLAKRVRHLSRVRGSLAHVGPALRQEVESVLSERLPTTTCHVALGSFDPWSQAACSLGLSGVGGATDVPPDPWAIAASEHGILADA